MDANALAERLMSPQHIADPYPMYRIARQCTPLFCLDIPPRTIPGIDEPMHAWALMKYADASQALKDHESFSSSKMTLVEKGVVPRFMLQTDDPPKHTRFRRLVDKTFTLKRANQLEPWITRATVELIERFEPGETDIIRSFAMPLPIKVIALLLGIPDRDFQSFKRWADASLSTTSPDIEGRRRNRQELLDYFAAAANERRHHRTDDLISALVESTLEGEPLSQEDLLAFCEVLLVAGSDTTTHLIGNMLNLLMDRPELWRKIRADRSLVPAVVEETLRFESPVQRLSRITTRDVEISGTMLPKGQMVTIFFGAANRDPQYFANADEFRIDQSSKNHLAFGLGIHFCLGATLARIEGAIVLNAFLDRFPELIRGEASALRQTSARSRLGFETLSLRTSHSH
jgi:cytochrome P450